MRSDPMRPHGPFDLRRSMAGVGRRHVLLGLSSGAFGAAPVVGRAQLLDPSAVARSRSPAPSGPSSGDMLVDPGSLGASRVSAGAARSRAGDHQPPSYARGVTSSVASSLTTLIRAYAGLAGRVFADEERLRGLRAKVAELERIKQAKLEEYRNGLFCSGCNQTKSEILAKGESFPHSGQTIIQPTQAQIDAKERQLQAPIDQADKARQALEAELPRLVENRNEALSQIYQGGNLWEVGAGFETLLIRQDARVNEAANRRQLTVAAEQVSKLHLRYNDVSQPVELKAHLDELERWGKIQRELEVKNQQIARTMNTELLQANNRSRKQREAIGQVAAVEAPKIQDGNARGLLTTWAGVFTGLAPLTGENGVDQGQLYRMGDHNVANRGKTLPEVETFLARYRGTQLAGLPPAPSQNSSFTDDVINRLKRKIQDMATCPENQTCGPKDLVETPAAAGPRG